MCSIKNKSLGFTLIELLLVISIIALMASVVLISLNKARSTARDTKRIADINQMRKALELYYLDYGVYPTTSAGSETEVALWDWLFASTMQPYIDPLPRDPRCPATGNPCTTVPKMNYKYIVTDVSAPQQGFGILIPFANDGNKANCKVRENGSASWFSNAPDCK